MAKVIVLVALFLCVLLPINIVSATTYKVGDDNGWTFGVGDWTNGKTFKAGDVLVFNYPPSIHNVYVVNEKSYNNCVATGDRFDSGNDQFTLAAGTTYFICGISVHCNAKLKMAVTAN